MKFGKRSKLPVETEQRSDPRSSFAGAPLPRHAGPPASSTPLADQLARGGPGVDADYVVLPRSLAEQMPLPWQRQMAQALGQFHQTHQGLSWPRYRVLPSREENLVDLDEQQLAEAGYVVEMDSNGELVYREHSGRQVDHPEHKKVLVTCLDPVIAGRRSAPPRADGPAVPSQASPGADAQAPVAPGAPRSRPPAPMNIGPQPVWHPVSPGERQQRPPAPPLPEQPVAEAPPAPSAPPAPPAQSAEPDVGAPEDDVATPPSGIAMPAATDQQHHDWFGEGAVAEEASDQAGDEAGVSGADPGNGRQDDRVEDHAGGEDDASRTFGPSGDPIERPYRFGG